MNRHLYKKIARNSILCFLLIGLFLFQTPLTHAALSSSDQSELDSVVTSRTTQADLIEILKYLLELYQNLVANSAGSSSSGSQSTSVDASVCPEVRKITDTLTRSNENAQVESLQRLLNTLAQRDTRYTPIRTSGEGAQGYETRYFGESTERALKAWQRIHMPTETSSHGTYDNATRNKMNQLYCGAAASATTGSTANTGSTNNTAPSTNQNSQTSPNGSQTSAPSTPAITEYTGSGTGAYIVQVLQRPGIMINSGSQFYLSGNVRNTDRLEVKIDGERFKRSCDVGFSDTSNGPDPKSWNCSFQVTNEMLGDTKVEFWVKEKGSSRSVLAGEFSVEIKR